MDEHLRINEQDDDVWTCHLLPSNVRTIEATITIRIYGLRNFIPPKKKHRNRRKNRKNLRHSEKVYSDSYSHLMPLSSAKTAETAKDPNRAKVVSRCINALKTTSASIHVEVPRDDGSMTIYMNNKLWKYTRQLSI